MLFSTKSKKLEEGIQNVSVENHEDLDIHLDHAIAAYNFEYNHLRENGENLFQIREQAKELLLKIEDLVNSIAKHPKKLDLDIAEIRIQRKNFQEACDFAAKELAAVKKSAIGTGTGVAGGMAVASLAPSAAMWIATTFGTASTGTAISALSGAAASNAALAWLGGGTLAAGGGGIAAGHALLALAGPIGWGIGGITVLVSIVLFVNKKAKLTQEKVKEIEAVLKNTEYLKKSNGKLRVILEETVQLYNGLAGQYEACAPYFGNNFKKLRRIQQRQLGTLVNNAKALSFLLGETLDG